MTDHKKLILDALAELEKAQTAHGPAVVALAEAQARVQEIQDAISSGNVRHGLVDLTDADTAFRGAALIEQGLSERIADLEQDIALKRGQQLAAEINNGTAGVVTDSGAAAWSKFYHTVKAATAELIKASELHEAARRGIEDRLSQTDYQHTTRTQVQLGGEFRTIQTPAGKPWSWIKHEDDRFGNPVIKARREGQPVEWADVAGFHVSDDSLERNARLAFFDARNGHPLDGAPVWTE